MNNFAGTKARNHVSAPSMLSACPLCGSKALSHWLEASDPHYGIAGRFAINRCGGCDARFLNPMPSDAYLATAYPETYYAHGAGTAEGSRIKQIIRRLIGFDHRRTGDPKFARPGRILDVGCGAGDKLVEFRAKGWQVAGVESSKAAAAAAGRAASGIEIFGGSLLEAAMPTAHFDYVRLNHSFEHMTNPRETLAEIRRILKTDGKLFIGVPNGEGLAARWFGAYWWNLGVPVHPFTYTPQSLKALIEGAGFKIERLNYNSNFASLAGSLQIYLNRKTGRPSHIGIVMGNPIAKLLAQWSAKLLDAARLGDCIEVIATPLPAPSGRSA